MFSIFITKHMRKKKQKRTEPQLSIYGTKYQLTYLVTMADILLSEDSQKLLDVEASLEDGKNCPH